MFLTVYLTQTYNSHIYSLRNKLKLKYITLIHNTFATMMDATYVGTQGTLYKVGSLCAPSNFQIVIDKCTWLVMWISGALTTAIQSYLQSLTM